MTKTRQYLLTVLSIAVLAILAFVVLRQPEPVYQGKQLSEWLLGTGGNNNIGRTSGGILFVMTQKAGDRRNEDLAREAVRHIGAAGIPCLLSLTGAHDSALRLKLIDLLAKQSFIKFHFIPEFERRQMGSFAFAALGEQGAVALTQGLKSKDKWVRRGCLIELQRFGDYSAIIIPPIIACLKDEQYFVRSQAANALGSIGKEPSIVVPALIEALHDPDGFVESIAARALGCFGTQAAAAVPMLLKKLPSENPQLRYMASNALQNIDPGAAAKAGKQ